MKNSNFQIATYVLTAIIALAFIWCLCLLMGPNETKAPSPPTPPIVDPIDSPPIYEGKQEVQEFYKNLPCKNFRSDKDIKKQVIEIAGLLGSRISTLADKSNYDEGQRKKAAEKVKELFEDPNTNVLEVLRSYQNPDIWQPTVAKYVDFLLRDKSRSYNIQWFVEEKEPKFQKITNGRYKTSIKIIQLLTREKLNAGANIRNWDEVYKDKTTKEVEIILIVATNENCESAQNQNATYNEGCCSIKIGNIKALKVEKQKQLKN